jgi:hypothetical protein
LGLEYSSGYVLSATQPTNWSADWHHRPVLRATENEPRRPIVRKPENLSPTADEGERRTSEMYWGTGNPMAWEDAQKIVDHGYPVRNKRSKTPCDIALFPAPSGLVIIDCDVKTYDRKTGFVMVSHNVAQPLPPQVEYGVLDLEREIVNLGHSMDELDTYTVSTKSGGQHLYFRENPTVRLKTSGHRKDWRVDVVAHNDGGDRSWVAAPPTANYEVIRDVQVVELPTWLASWLRNEMPKLPPVGGEKMRQRLRDRQEARDRALLPGSSGDDRDSLQMMYAGWILDEVVKANQEGGWNLAIYAAVKDLLKVGYALETVAEMVLEAAGPVNETERRNAEYTIASAERSYLQETYQSGGAA